MTEQKALTVTPKRSEVIEHGLRQREDALKAILPSTMPVERFIKTVTIAISKNPDLAECTGESIMVAVMEAAEAGLTPTGSLSRAWLVPFKDKGVPKAQLIIGWMGLIDLARRSGDVAGIDARVVYAGDFFEVHYGTDPKIIHDPDFGVPRTPENITHAYMTATMKDRTKTFEVMTKAEIDLVRARARSANKGPWVSDYAEMARKTVVRRGIKYLPLTPEAIAAVERDDEAEFGGEVRIAEPTAKTKTLRESLAAQAAEIKPEKKEEPVDGGIMVEKFSSAAGGGGSAKDASVVTSEAPAVEQTEPKPAADSQVASPGSPICGAVSPYDDGATCDRDRGHRGSHMGQAEGTIKREAW